MTLRIWLEAARPKTLTAAVAPILIGTSLASGAFYPPRWDLALFALASALCIQIGTNLVNDAMDFEKGADDDARIGPRRVTQSGLLAPRLVLRGGWLAFAAAALFAIPLLTHGGWVILGIGVLSLLCGYAYTAGPFPLAYLGLGDLFVLLFFGLAAVTGVYYLNTGIVDLKPLVAGAQIGSLATVLIAINNLRDAEGDRRSRKNTLAVRFGKTFSRVEIAVLSLAPFPLGFYWYGLGFRGAAVLPLLCLPFALALVFLVSSTEPSPRYNRFLGIGAALHLMFGILLSAGFLLA